MDDIFPKKKKRSIAGLQLAPLIDIFVLIIIFLIKGTVMSNASVTPPADLNPAKSKSPEGLEPAGQVYISQKEVLFTMINEKISLAELNKQIENNTPAAMTGQAGQISQKLKGYIQGLPDQEKKSGILLNFLADAGTDYKTVFEIAKYCRELGFQNILFVAQGDK
jgi:biopolymer transport protein ExbD